LSSEANMRSGVLTFPTAVFARSVSKWFVAARFNCFSMAAICLSIFAPCATAWTAEPDVDKKLDVAYARRDGEPLTLDAYLLTSPGSHPAVVFVHGGGFVTGDKRPCPSYILDPYLKNGYSVVSVNYRLAPQHPFPAATEDVSTSIDFVHRIAAEWRINPMLIVLTGESAGGLISALVGVTLPEKNRVAAVIPMCGEVDLELRISEDPCFMDGHMVARPPRGCISKGLAAFFGFSEVTTDEQRRTVRAASTITHIRADMPPYLLAHGTRDHGVPYEQSVSLQQAMLKIGADCTLLPVVGGGHGNWTPQQWQEVEDFEFKWLAQKLKHP
jgi:acetyl esterase/lipase